MENYVRSERLLLTYRLHVCLSWKFVWMRHCVLTWVIKNFGAGHIKCSRGPQVRQPCLRPRS